MTPEFAILGHPNEGKSSVLSTLAEDDSVRVSATPGETTECRTFPVIIDGREVLRFTDTPGFQNPARVLSELQKRADNEENPLKTFRECAAQIPELHDDCELLGPVERGAGIIYVVDGSRPVRNVDRAEMEILRLTGKPRMAILNCKEDETDNLLAWKNEFRKNFNSNRIFNAHRATYAERILLLETLKSIDQDWHQVLSEVVTAFKKDWAARNNATADIITAQLRDALSLQLTRNISSEGEADQCRKKLFLTYSKTISRMEKNAHQRIRSYFKHNIFQYDLPPHSVLNKDLFDERTWQLLGLTRQQVIIAGGLGGAAIGAGLDVAALGHGLGMFTAMGTIAGALGALFGGENFSDKAKFLGIPLGGKRVQVGPAKSIDLFFVLLNRSLLYYQHTINWAHGRRDYAKRDQSLVPIDSPQGFTKEWSAGNIKICHDFFKIIRDEKGNNGQKAVEKFRQLLLTTMQDISESD
jgi:GTP-binding protein EngB required for normal cell division